eukprot:gb/GEZN01013239.1/.p1 GENE.gb/GEZN01013239.1/~~gb/GEZN01013239.1/.p1  ORF type:complete len:324 (-),score=46.45 gb/GEZN01013239.1/:54-1001(-)
MAETPSQVLFGADHSMDLFGAVSLLFGIILVQNAFMPLIFFVLLPWTEVSGEPVWTERGGKPATAPPPRPAWSTVRRELFYGALAALIFSFPFGGVIWLFGNRPEGTTAIYLKTDWNLGTCLYWPLSIFLYMAVHDTYFFWTHLLMHKYKKVYNVVHKVHHLSRPPTPWSNFSFSAWESMVHAIIVPICCFFIPIHCSALLSLLLIMTLFGVWHHTGQDVLPRSVLDNAVFQALIVDSAHHWDHHAKYTCNYALYFKWWDRWMDTEFPKPASVSNREPASHQQSGLRSDPADYSKNQSKNNQTNKNSSGNKDKEL